MPANVQPLFLLTPVIGMVKIATANTARDGSGTMSTIVTGGTNGTTVTTLQVKAEVTTTAGVIRVYVSNTTAANTTANTFLLKEIVVTAVTASGTAASFDSTLTFDDLKIPSGSTLRVSTDKAESFSVTARGGDY